MSEPTEYVYVARYTHKHGMDVHVFRTEESANKLADEIAKDYWTDHFPNTPIPTEGAADAYFSFLGEQGEEFLEVERVEVLP